jgi:hypothetical protein
MLREERYEESAIGIKAAQKELQSRLWTTLPVIVESYNAANQTATVKSAVKSHNRQMDGTWVDDEMTPFTDVPVKFPSAGGLTMTFPIKAGDEGTVHFAARSIEGWWGKGGVQAQTVLRQHHLADGFLVLGGRSMPRKLANVSTETVQVRTDDGKHFIELTADGVVNVIATTVRIVAPTKIRFETPLLEIIGGKITADKDITSGGEITAAGDIIAGKPPSSSSTSFAEPEQQSGGVPSTPGAVIGAALTSAEQAIGTWQAITNGSFQVSINNVLQQVTGLNFSAVQSLAGVANTITTGLGLAGSMNWSPLGQFFGLTSATVGINSAVGFLSSIPGIGTDISRLLKMTQDLGRIVAGTRGSISLLEHLHQLVRAGPNNTGDPT